MISPLPVDAVLDELTSRLDVHGSIVLQAPPGAGKTTRVPPALLRHWPQGQVIVLEPRRLAARLSALRVAEELGTPIGDLVGYDVRFDRKVSSRTRLLYVTEGIFQRKLLQEPSLPGVRAVVLDEFHERHLQGDLALSLLQRLRGQRSDLSLVVMSATLDGARVASFLGDAPIVTSEGRRFDVQVEYLPRPDDRPLESQVASAVRRLVDEGLDGDVLVFLPGTQEIQRAAARVEALAQSSDLLVLPLHGELPPDAQDRVLQPTAKRKVILATNVAETSITLPNVVAVVDSGLVRVAAHDVWSGRTRLEVRKISRASAAQRQGRAGRVREGRCLRLCTKGDHDTRPEFDVPEIQRADLAELVLHLRAIGVAPSELAWLTEPPKDALAGSEALLRSLHAVDAAGRLTELGVRMTRLPLHPRFARIVLEAQARGLPRDGCMAAAILSDGRDVYRRRDREGRAALDGHCDVLTRMVDMADGASELDRGVVSAVFRVRDQLLQALDSRGNRAPQTSTEAVDVALRKSILAGYPDRVAQRRGRESEVVLCQGGSARIAEESVVRSAPWLVAVEAGEHRSGARRSVMVSLATAIEPDWLLEIFPSELRDEVDVRWNEADQRAEVRERLVYERLVLDERELRSHPAASALLLERARAAGPWAFAGNDSEREQLEQLVKRRAFVAQAPDLGGSIPPIDEQALAGLVAARCEGKRSFAELREYPLLHEVQALLGASGMTKLDALAPTHAVLGNGRKTAIRYQEGQPPSLESRLSDFFGTAEGPRVLGGRVPVVLHLLAPSGRDVQVTTDLAGFWVRTYPEVRRELMRRYPRHPWPEDPRNAEPPALRRRPG